MIRRREYKDYKDYLDHQSVKTLKVKAGTCGELGLFETRLFFMKQILAWSLGPVVAHGKAVCLGARRGEEVQALRDLGFDAIGIDIVEFPPLVVKGDFHVMPFEDGEFNLVFSNAVDHAHDLPTLAREVRRVTASRAIVILHLTVGEYSEEMSLGITSAYDVSAVFVNAGFGVVRSESMIPYGGGINHLLVMRKCS